MAWLEGIVTSGRQQRNVCYFQINLCHKNLCCCIYTLNFHKFLVYMYILLYDTQIFPLFAKLYLQWVHNYYTTHSQLLHYSFATTSLTCKYFRLRLRLRHDLFNIKYYNTNYIQIISGHQYIKWTNVQWKGKVVTATALLHLPKTEGESLPQPAVTSQWRPLRFSA